MSKLTRNFGPALAAALLTGALALADTWDAAYEAVPAATDPVSEGDDAIRDMRKEVRFRAEVEHHWGPASNTDDTGLHRLGSARTFLQDTEPTALEGSSTDYAGSGASRDGTGTLSSDNSSGSGEDVGDGRLWLDTDNRGLLAYFGDDFHRLFGAQNILTNGGFVAQNSGADTAPDGWTLVDDGAEAGAPTLTLQASPVAESDAQELNLVAETAAAASGITQTLDGLRPSTVYRVEARMQETTGNCAISTSGGGTDLSATGPSGSGGSSWETITGTFTTDSTPTDVVLSILTETGGAAAVDDCDIAHVRVWEESGGSGSPAAGGWPGAIGVSDTDTVADFALTLASGFETVSGLQTEVVPPGPGYLVITLGLVSIGCDVGSCEAQVRVRESTTQCGIANFAGGSGDQETVPVVCLNMNPTPGTALTYDIQADETDDPAVINYTSGNNPVAETKLITVMLPMF